MKKIASFTVNHLKLLPGIYVSRKDKAGKEILTTFDLRITKPNDEPVMGTSGIHAMEHLGATFLRNHPVWAEKTIYFGPMGCRTGFYLVLAGDYQSIDIVPLVKEMFDFMKSFEGKVPGASERDCGNCHDIDLAQAKIYIEKYIKEVLEKISEERLVYPD